MEPVAPKQRSEISLSNLASKLPDHVSEDLGTLIVPAAPALNGASARTLADRPPLFGKQFSFAWQTTSLLELPCLALDVFGLHPRLVVLFMWSAALLLHRSRISASKIGVNKEVKNNVKWLNKLLTEVK